MGPDATKGIITIESPDGDRIRGTFSGALVLDEEPSRTIEISEGRFDVVLRSN